MPKTLLLYWICCGALFFSCTSHANEQTDGFEYISIEDKFRVVFVSGNVESICISAEGDLFEFEICLDNITGDCWSPVVISSEQLKLGDKEYAAIVSRIRNVLKQCSPISDFNSATIGMGYGYCIINNREPRNYTPALFKFLDCLGDLILFSLEILKNRNLIDAETFLNYSTFSWSAR